LKILPPYASKSNWLRKAFGAFTVIGQHTLFTNTNFKQCVLLGQLFVTTLMWETSMLLITMLRCI